MHFHSMSIKETLQVFNVNDKIGLANIEAEKRLEKFGVNELAAKKGKSLLVRFFSQFSDFMILVLICAAAISFGVSVLKGETDYVDPIIIFAIIILNAVLGVIQEAKAERSLEALKQMAAPHAICLRDGKQQQIPANLLVPGDIIYLETGHYVPADARLIECTDLRIDESSLTGESHPAEKDCNCILKENTMLGDRKNMVLSSGIVTFGRGKAIVCATGMHTEVGHIARMILQDNTPDTPLQKKLAKTGKYLGIAALGICIFIFFLGTMQGREVFDMFMTSVSLAVAAIPEGLPAIVTIMLSLGVQRMAKKNAIIRKLPAVETLGSATFICSDKTGTLTQNRMTVTEIASLSGIESEHGSFAKHLLSFATLCNNASMSENGKDAIGEPTEKALIMAAYKNKLYKQELEANYPRIREVPFDSSRKLMTTVHRQKDGKNLIITKGAYDILIRHCTYVEHNGTSIPLQRKESNQLDRICLSMTEKALRVLAVAYKVTDRSINYMTDNALLNDLTFQGMMGMIDPPRKEVKNLIQECMHAGITPVMITGDHVSTACAIAKTLGILSEKSNESNAISGEELNKMSDEQLKKQIYSYRVFARVSPQHKVRIVKALQSRGEVVAMTGDGVNDAPALKAADIGCAMGLSGTDVAKNAADMILADDNFGTIVSAIKEGRGIYDNIKKSIHFLLSSNIGEIITILIAILFGLSAPLLAVQLLWINLVTDSLPAISLGVEAPDKDIMYKKPISQKKGMFSDGMVFKIIFEGSMIGSLALIAYILKGQTMCFAVLGLSQLFHAFNMRSERSIFKIGWFSNKKMVLSFLVCTLLQVAVISIRPLAVIFKVTPLTFGEWLLTFALSFIPIVIVELQKLSRH